jgi:transcriptional regulator with XRE-family HTH domain
MISYGKFLRHIWIDTMGSPKSKLALERLGQDVRSARLRRGVAVADLAVRAGTSPSSVARLEKGDPGVAIGTLADALVVLGLVERLADLIDIRKDDLGLALAAERQPRRGRSFATALRRQKAKGEATQGAADIVDQDGVSF